MLPETCWIKRRKKPKKNIEKNDDVSEPAITKASKENSGKSVGEIEQKTGTKPKVNIKDLGDKLPVGGR